jgi:hypothetical protein
MIDIIKAEERHIPDICNLWLEFMQFSQDIDPIFKPRDGAVPFFEEEYLRPVTKSKNSLVLVALDGEKVVGYSLDIDHVEIQVILKNEAAVSFRRKQGYMDFQNTLYRQI